MDSTDLRNQLLDEIIDKMETSLADKAYPSEQPKEEAPIEEIKVDAEAPAPTEEPKEDELSAEDMAALEAFQGE